MAVLDVIPAGQTAADVWGSLVLAVYCLIAAFKGRSKSGRQVVCMSYHLSLCLGPDQPRSTAVGVYKSAQMPKCLDEAYVLDFSRVVSY